MILKFKDSFQYNTDIYPAWMSIKGLHIVKTSPSNDIVCTVILSVVVLKCFVGVIKQLLDLL